MPTREVPKEGPWPLSDPTGHLAALLGTQNLVFFNFIFTPARLVCGH